MGMVAFRAAAVSAVALGLLASFSAEAASGVGSRVTARAARLVGVARLSSVTTRVPDDCSGVVRLPYLREGVDLIEGDGYPPHLNAVTVIYLRAKRLGAITRSRARPAP